jgi:hypothetical protein
MKSKKIFGILFLILFFVFSKSTTVSAGSISIDKERIENYEITQIINSDGSIMAEEKITFDSYGNGIQNGLVRTWPKKIVDENGKEINLILSDFSLTLDNVNSKFTVNQDNSNSIFIYMGDSGKLLTNGKHVFTLKYKIEGLIIPYSYKYDKYFFFPTGEWNLAIEKTIIKIVVPEGKNVTLIKTEMKKEKSGEVTYSQIDYYSIKNNESGQITLIPSEATLSGESLSLTILFPKDFVNISRSSFYLKYFGFYIAIGIIFILSLFLLIKKTEHKKKSILYLCLIPFVDMIPAIFIFNKNNSNFLLSLFTILLVLETDLILFAFGTKINKWLSLVKYSIITFFALFYCYYLINFSLKLQAVVLLLLILSQIIIINIKKKTLV